MRKLLVAVTLFASITTAAPTLAEAHARGAKHHRHQSYERAYAAPVYYRDRRGCRTSGTTGLIIGGAAGALLGRELDGGRDRAAGTVLGAGAGALLGREVSRKSRC